MYFHMLNIAIQGPKRYADEAPVKSGEIPPQPLGGAACEQQMDQLLVDPSSGVRQNAESRFRRIARVDHVRGFFVIIGLSVSRGRPNFATRARCCPNSNAGRRP